MSLDFNTLKMNTFIQSDSKEIFKTDFDDSSKPEEMYNNFHKNSKQHNKTDNFQH